MNAQQLLQTDHNMDWIVLAKLTDILLHASAASLLLNKRLLVGYGMYIRQYKPCLTGLITKEELASLPVEILVQASLDTESYCCQRYFYV